MGNGPSAALGKDSFLEENRNFLDKTLHRIGANECELDLDLANRFIGDEGIRLGAPALRSNNTIKTIDLGFNHLTSASIADLISGIQNNPSLVALNLGGNPIGDSGCARLAQFLARNPPLEELSLYHCNITDEGLHSLVNGLLDNTNLAVIRLDMNELTDLSLEMLIQLVGEFKNKCLCHTTLCGNPGPFPQATLNVFHSLTQQARDNLVARKEAEQEERRQELDRMEQERLAAERDEAEREAAREAAEREEAEAEERIRQEQEALRQHELEHGAAERAALQKGAHQREEERMKSVRMKEQALESAYRWRDKLTGNGSLVREWRDGFTVMKTQPGEAPGAVPSVVPEPPRRLKACWCDPHDVSAPYAKTLHYHCKYEAQNKQLSDDGDGVNKYHGCRSSGHICATVGFYAKPLPDTSAAHFFASQHPASVQ